MGEGRRQEAKGEQKGRVVMSLKRPRAARSLVLTKVPSEQKAGKVF